jgi:hypothetical protein
MRDSSSSDRAGAGDAPGSSGAPGPSDSPPSRNETGGAGGDTDVDTSGFSRRSALKLIGLMAAAPTFSFGCTSEQAEQAQSRASGAPQASTAPGADYERRLFSDHEFETVTTLADCVIPADDRSGSASDARVPEFIDFILTDDLLPNRQAQQTAIRGGLAWLDYQCLERFDALFVDCREAQQTEMLDAIAYPEEAAPEMQRGVTFFNSFRDLVASGFFSSKMGVKDLRYRGNKVVKNWTGCPSKALDHLGIDDDSAWA